MSTTQPSTNDADDHPTVPLNGLFHLAMLIDAHARTLFVDNDKVSCEIYNTNDDVQANIVVIQWSSPSSDASASSKTRMMVDLNPSRIMMVLPDTSTRYMLRMEAEWALALHNTPQTMTTLPSAIAHCLAAHISMLNRTAAAAAIPL